MHRRQVLRVLGGGVIAAAVPVGGCSSALPPEAIGRLLGVRTAGQTVQMWARLGYGPPVGPAPRRGVDELILYA